MGPGGFGKRWTLAGVGAAPLALFSAVPALAQAEAPMGFVSALPLAIALGAAGFGVLALLALRSLRKDGRQALHKAHNQVAALRAQLDEYEALLSGTRELTILWAQNGSAPKFLGQAAAVLPPGRRAEAVLDFSSWLKDSDCTTLAHALEVLKVQGQGFDLQLSARDGRVMRATGWVLGGGAALRLRPAFLQPEREPLADPRPLIADLNSACAILGLLSKPAFARDTTNKLIFANPAYLQLAQSLGKKGSESHPPEMLEPASLKRHLVAVGGTEAPVRLTIAFPDSRRFDLVEFQVAGGKAGYLTPLTDSQPAPLEGLQNHINGIIDALATPIAIFNANRELVQFNRAYASLWGLDLTWLKLGLDERTILDRLRTQGLLPAEPDYKAWRAKHLESYTLKVPRESDPWHLPDGRTIKVISAPAGPKGGVIYVFEDITERLILESRNRALSNVQRETINALSEGVAVFGTNGRLALFNPRFSALWKLPMNELGLNPHVDGILDLAAKAMPEDGARVWDELKRAVVDLNPTRSDATGRIARADGRLLDYAIIRLPDGQTMMTFVDVTESTNYSRVLKERNDALVTADRMKDIFVQNVSYELRSPLTNIIGFADLLASGEFGELNERQRSYTDYIRASSTTLGVLIDNILDLTTVDAGMTELHPELQDVPSLVEKAKAGLAAIFPQTSTSLAPKLVIDIAPGLPPFIADGTRIVQILYNLLSNAARFSDPNGEVRLSVTPRGKRIVFAVEDEGDWLSEGLTAQTLDTPVVAGRQRGAALGLVVAKTFANLHGGTLNFERREPKGTRVVVNLPADCSQVSVQDNRSD